MKLIRNSRCMFKHSTSSSLLKGLTNNMAGTGMKKSNMSVFLGKRNISRSNMAFTAPLAPLKHITNKRINNFLHQVKHCIVLLDLPRTESSPKEKYSKYQITRDYKEHYKVSHSKLTSPGAFDGFRPKIPWLCREQHVKEKPCILKRQKNLN